MPKVSGSTTGGVAAGLVPVAGPFAILSGSASATPAPVPKQQVRPEKVTGAPRYVRPVPPAMATTAELSGPGTAPVIRALRGPAGDGTVVRVR